jgi:hypothetical protein
MHPQMNFFKKLAACLGSGKSEKSETRPSESETLLKLQSEIAGLQLTIAELRAAQDNQQALLMEAERSRAILAEESANARMNAHLSALASPLAQLALLQSLAGQGKEIKSANIFKIIDLIGETLADAGMEQLYHCGDSLPFNGEQMSPATSGLNLQEGDSAIVRMPGFRFNGKVIHKALADKL